MMRENGPIPGMRDANVKGLVLQICATKISHFGPSWVAVFYASKTAISPLKTDFE